MREMRKIMKKNEKERGFTLVELLIVVAIIAILTGIAVPNFMGARKKARVSKALGDMHTTTNALQAYAVDHGKYMTTYSTADLVRTGLISSVPKDPFSGNDFNYYTTPSGTVVQWVITSVGPNGTGNFSSSSDWGNVVAGPLGGPESAITTTSNDDTYPPAPWYDPTGTRDDNKDDLGYGGP